VPRPLPLYLWVPKASSGNSRLQKSLPQLRIAETPGDAVAWCHLGFAKARHESPDSGLFTAQSFDRMIGDRDAVTDIPCAIFGPELLKAHPSAKVVLNCRKDDEAWVRSARSTVIPVASSWSYWFKSFFDSEAFWIRRTYDACFILVFQTRHSTSNDKGLNFGRQLYKEYYSLLESIMRTNGREWLDWDMHDSWAPLCGFLGKKEPQGFEFPSRNDLKEFTERRARLHGEMMQRARCNMWIAGGVRALESS
jgi:hypothetical protein